MKLFLRIFTLFGIILVSGGAEISAQNITGDENVITVGEESVSLNDFKHIYGKNNRDSVITREAIEETCLL
ncbi:MAG TPA: hypothetical protein EYN19_01825, partial [Flavobacteriales bacterium]|nr:hypothetical protein [Flavobacteriales bacterium]